MLKKDLEGSEIAIELTPEWWGVQSLTVKDSFIVIPDKYYPKSKRGIVYESTDNSTGTDYFTGVIVHAESDNQYVGYWCHYKKHGPYEFHPFRERLTDGGTKGITTKGALLVRCEDMVLITDQKIF